MAEHIELKSFSTKVGEKDIRYSIKEIKNGFIISKSSEYKDEKGCMQYETEEIFSEKNPFEEQSENLYDIIEASLGEKPVEQE